MYAARPADRGITSLAISENGQRLALGADDGHVEVWDVQGFEITARTLTHSGRVISVALNTDGSRVASLGRDGKIVVADLKSDPLFGIKAGTLRSTTTQIMSEEMKSARRIYFLSNGDILLSTSEGQLGELKMSSGANVSAPTSSAQPFRVNSGTTTTEKGSDY
jgi:WD40 repeat protein